MILRALAALSLCLPLAAAPPTPLIFDTDMGNDIDDALALAMIHAFSARGEAKLLAVTITKDNAWAAPFIDLVNHFYRQPSIPIGMVKNGKTPEDSPYIRVPSERKAANGKPLYPRRIKDGSQTPEAAGLIRGLLEKQTDHSVVIAQVGFSTNLAKLLDLPEARDLIQRKVKLLSVMAGQFPAGKPEYNVRIDIEAARKVFSQWPGDIVFSGFEIGLALPFPAQSIQEDFRYAVSHPIADAYAQYKKMPYDRPTWDLTSVLYAIRPDRGYFSLSPRGTVTVGADGTTAFQPDEKGRHRYLLLNAEQRPKVIEALIQLASQPPSAAPVTPVH